MLTDFKKIKVAIVHDWLFHMRGGEKVLEAILELFPEADIYTLFHSPDKLSLGIKKHRIFTSFLNYFPFKNKLYQYLLPFFPMAIESWNLTDYDLILSSSHCAAKGVIPSPKALHLCYCHTPMRYIWDKTESYFGKKIWLQPLLNYLRLWDSTNSNRVDYFIANSNWVADRIRTYYRRESTVINPFVDIDKLKPQKGDKGDYYLVVSAFAPNKGIDLAILSCKALGRKLIVVGSGSAKEENNLKRIAAENTLFTGWASESELADLYAGCRALIFPGEDDFGMVPLEAMACGKPIIALKKGGATETVIEGITGLFFEIPNVDSLTEVIMKFEAIENTFEPKAARQRAEEFTKLKFQENFLNFVNTKWQNHLHRHINTDAKKTLITPRTHLI